MFRGQVDGNLTAYDAKTGDELWKFQTGWGISAPPMTYEVDGVQYVAVAAGGNRGGVTTTDGDAVWAFALNGTLDQVAGAAAGPDQGRRSPGASSISATRSRDRALSGWTIGSSVDRSTSSTMTSHRGA